jgi:ATP-dependent DNA helicase RecG
LKRAAILLFHKNPENFITGAYIKIGYFETDDDLRFQDEIHGNLFEQIEKTMDLLFTKYIRAEISYDGINRIETYEYPRDAIREALLNAIAHKDYAGGIPIQISTYADKIMIWNEGQLPENWTVKNLLEKHASRPYNPDIANALFRSGYIESWGRGTLKIVRECKLAGAPEPTFKYDSSDISVEFKKDIYNEKYLETINLNYRQIKAILFLKSKLKITNREYQILNEVSRETATRDLKDLTEKQLLKTSGQKGAGAFYTLN